MISSKTLFHQTVDKFSADTGKGRRFARKTTVIIGSALAVGMIPGAYAAESLFDEVAARTAHPDAAIISTVVALIFMVVAGASYIMWLNKRH